MSKRSYVNDVQKNVMADYFINNPKIIRNSFSENFTYADSEQLWDELSRLLNASGPAQKDVKKWKKTWDDIKRVVKEKVSAINREKCTTGNKPSTTTPLSEIEDKFASIIGEVLILGDPEIQEAGFGNPVHSPIAKTNVVDLHAVDLFETIQSTSENLNQSTHIQLENKKNKNKRKFDEADDILKYQKSLADATSFQGRQLERIAKAMEARNVIEQQRNSILMMRYGISVDNGNDIVNSDEDIFLNNSEDLL